MRKDKKDKERDVTRSLIPSSNGELVPLHPGRRTRTPTLCNYPRSHTWSSLFIEPFPSVGLIVDHDCDLCYDTPPTFDIGKDEVVDHSLIDMLLFGGPMCCGKDGLDLEESKLHELDKVVYDDSSSEPSLDSLSMLNHDIEMHAFIFPLCDDNLICGSDLYRARVGGQIEPPWCEGFDSLGNHLFENLSEVDGSLSDPTIASWGYDEEESIINAFLESLSFEKGCLGDEIGGERESLGVSKYALKKGSGVLDVTCMLGYLAHSTPHVDHTSRIDWFVDLELKVQGDFDSLILHFSYPHGLFDHYCVRCIMIFNQALFVLFGDLIFVLLIDAWLYHKSVFSTLLALTYFQSRNSCVACRCL
uniref:Uncharacterized protein n=1 Tax=Petunia hybrida TaxID=4102 RepID=Q6VPQ0_PETHY|nr:unknown [Petunia x hybrida]